MPNWEQMAGAMTQPFGGIEQPQQQPQFNMQEMARGFMDALRGIGTAMAPQNVSKTMAQPLVNMPPQGMWEFLLGKVPPEMMNAPVGEEEKKQLTQKAYDWVEPHLFATGGLLAGVGAKATDLLSSIRSLQPKGQERALVSISELRDKLGMPSKEFDEQLLKLAQEGKVFLHKHDFASSLKPEERAKLLAIPNKNAHWGGNDYYIGVVPK